MVSVLVAALISLSSFVLTTSSYSASSDVISREGMETYVQAFLDTYNIELEDNFRPQFRDLFPFFSDFTYAKMQRYRILGVLSWNLALGIKRFLITKQ